jgi:hypothetical protein
VETEGGASCAIERCGTAVRMSNASGLLQKLLIQGIRGSTGKLTLVFNVNLRVNSLAAATGKKVRIAKSRKFYSLFSIFFIQIAKLWGSAKASKRTFHELKDVRQRVSFELE